MKRALLILFILLFAACESELDLAGVEAGNATLAGILQDKNGKAMAGVTVALSAKRTGKQLDTDVTSANGHFEFRGLATGDYVLKAKLSGQQQITEYVTVDSDDSDLQVTLDASDALPVAKTLPVP